MVDLAFGARLQDWLIEAGQAAQQNVPRPDPPPEFALAVSANVGATVVLFVASLLATAAVVAIVHGTFRGDAAPARAGLSQAFSRLSSLLVGQLLYFVGILVVVMLALMLGATFLLAGGLLALLGFVALVGGFVVVLFFGVRTSLMTVAIMAERGGGAAGMARSWRLVADNGWRVFAYLILIAIVGTIAGILFSTLVLAVFPFDTGSFADAFLRTVIGVVPGFLLAPLSPIVLTLLYFDLCWRHGERVPLPGGGET